MRTLVDLPDDTLAELNELSRSERVSRASLIREALADWLAMRRPRSFRDSEGLWGPGEDAVAYQRRLRDDDDA